MFSSGRIKTSNWISEISADPLDFLKRFGLVGWKVAWSLFAGELARRSVKPFGGSNDKSRC